MSHAATLVKISHSSERRGASSEAGRAKMLSQVRHEQFIHRRKDPYCVCACVPACTRCSGWHSLLQTAYINTVGRGRSVRSHVDYISLHGRKSQSCPRARPRRKRERGRAERAFSISRSGILKLLPCSGTNSIRFTAAENEQGMEG